MDQMSQQTSRQKQFEKRRAELKTKSDQELKELFWQLCHQAVKPMVEFSTTHTSPSIERSVLMRMGIDSFTAMAVVKKIVEAGMMGKGAGHAVWKLSKKMKISIPEAAKTISEKPEVLKELF